MRGEITLLITDETDGKRIAYHRKKHKLSRSKLAFIVGMEDNHLYRIETGLNCPRINLIARLAVVFGVSIDELVRGMDRPRDMY